MKTVYRYVMNAFNISKNLFRSRMRKLKNIHLATGGCIMKENNVVSPTVKTKGCWNGMIMDGTNLKNITRKYSKESFVKANINARKKFRITSILRIQQRNTRNQRKMTNGHPTVRRNSQNRLAHGNGSICPMMSSGMPSSIISKHPMLIEGVLFYGRL